MTAPALMTDPGRSAANPNQERMEVTVTVATGHSGSTLFSLFLDCHPEIVSVGECSVSRKTRKSLQGRQYLCSCRAPIRECALFSKVFEAVRSDGFPIDDGNWVNDYRYDSPMLHAVLSNYGRTAKRRRVQQWCDRLLPWHAKRQAETDRANESFIRAVLAQTGKRVFFDSCKSLYRHAHLMAIPALDVKALRIVRDARAYAGSFKRKGQAVEESAWSWRWYQESADALLAGIEPERIHVVRYEDFCADPAASLDAIVRFLGAESSPLPLTINPREHHVIGNRIRMADEISIRLNETWREALTTAERDTVDRIAGAMNARFGYTD